MARVGIPGGEVRHGLVEVKFGLDWLDLLEQAEFEDLEQSTGTGADDDHVGLDGHGAVFLTMGHLPGWAAHGPRPLYRTPTVERLWNFEYTRDNPEALDNDCWKRGLAEDTIEDIEESIQDPGELLYYQLTPKRKPTLERKIAQLRESGVVMMIGTDSGIPPSLRMAPDVNRGRDTRGQVNTSTTRKLIVLVVAGVLLSGCASFGEGLGRALLSRVQGDDYDDYGACEIWGEPFEGIEQALQRQDGQPAIGETPSTSRSVVKIMMVHGIGSHFPGYSGRTVTNLAAALGLDVRAPQTKTMEIPDPLQSGASRGTLTLVRLTDTVRERELLAYELTWSRISDPARARLRFDSTQLHSRNRARLNQLGKSFVNNALVDPLIYVGAGRDQILDAVRQGLCWAYSTDWDGFPDQPERCSSADPGFGSRATQDRYFYVTHSLGSRILLDALETTAEGIVSQLGTNPRAIPFRAALQDHVATVFMMANQLPLLQAGFPPVPVRGQIDAYCTPSGASYEQRILAQARIVAFSDPNDLLSYPIPEDFVQNDIDSRLCPEAVNVSLNIARVANVFSNNSFANPLTAHNEYNNDARVIGLMAGGLGQDETPAVVEERCSWVQLKDELR